MGKYENNVKEMSEAITNRFCKLVEEEASSFVESAKDDGVPEKIAKSFEEVFKMGLCEYYPQNMAIFLQAVSFVCKHPDCIEEGEMLRKSSVEEISQFMMSISMGMLKEDCAASIVSDVVSKVKEKEEGVVSDSVSFSVFRL